MRARPTYTVLLASPRDLAEERQVVEEVVAELNLGGGDHRIELLRWETHATPGLGRDAQDVINQAFPDHYDLFVGLLWTRLGTPTPRAESGTLEEFEGALSRARQFPKRVEIMVFFKDTAVNPSKIDPSALQAVKAFQARLETLGCLHWSFSDKDELAYFLRLHIPRAVARLSQESRHEPSRSTPYGGSQTSEAVVEEPGLLDLLAAFQEGVEQSTSILTRITEETATLGQAIETRAKELNTLPPRHGQPDYRGARRIANEVAIDLDRFASRIEGDLTLLPNAFQTVFDSIAGGVVMAIEQGQMTPGEAREVFDSSEQLAITIETTEAHVGEFRRALGKLPRATSRLNNARRRAARDLDAFLLECARLRTMARELRKVVENG